MITNNKILPIALVAALLGGSAGAFVMRPSKTADPAAGSPNRFAAPVATAHNSLTTPTAGPIDSSVTASVREQDALSGLTESDEVAAYRQGFTEGVQAVRAEQSAVEPEAVRRRVALAPAARNSYSTGRETRYARRVNSSRQVYNNGYYEPRKRSFWSKHRDKLTVAAGAGGGALIGGLIGGKKGAAIGAISGGAGSAIYTYKLRKKNRPY